MKLSLLQLIFLAILFFILFQSKFKNIPSYYKSFYQFLKKKEKTNSDKPKIDN